MNVLTDSLIIFTDNVVGSDAILSVPLRQPLFKLVKFRCVYYFISLMSSKFRRF